LLKEEYGKRKGWKNLEVFEDRREQRDVKIWRSSGLNYKQVPAGGKFTKYLKPRGK
jgi:hypothetical protein